MFHGQIIAEIEAALSAAGVGHGLIKRLLPVILMDVLTGKDPAAIIADILAQFGTPATPAA